MRKGANTGRISVPIAFELGGNGRSRLTARKSMPLVITPSSNKSLFQTRVRFTFEEDGVFPHTSREPSEGNEWEEEPKMKRKFPPERPFANHTRMEESGHPDKQARVPESSPRR